MSKHECQGCKGPAEYLSWIAPHRLGKAFRYHEVTCKNTSLTLGEYSDAPLAWCHCAWCEENRPKPEPREWTNYVKVASELGIEMYPYHFSPKDLESTPAAKDTHEKTAEWWSAEYKAAKDDKIEPMPEEPVEIRFHYHQQTKPTPFAKEMYEKASALWNTEEDGETITMTGVDFSNGKDTGGYVEIFHLPGGRSHGINEPEAEGSAASQIGQMIVSKVAHFETVTNPDGSLRYITLVPNEPKRRAAKRRNRNA